MNDTAVKLPRTFKSEKILKPKNLENFPLPTIFSPEINSLDIEIGCGVGWHPIQYAGSHPDRFLVAIEHTREKFTKFQNRFIHHAELKNLLPVHANAVAWITHSLKPETVSRILILYPNPEPKSANKRWIRMPFMSKLVEVLRPDGEIIFATNEIFYREEIMQFSSHVNLKVASNEVLSKTSKPRTHFEKKYLERGDDCFNLVLKKNY